MNILVSADNGFAKFNDALEGIHFNWTFLKLLSIDKSGLSAASKVNIDFSNSFKIHIIRSRR